MCSRIIIILTFILIITGAGAQKTARTDTIYSSIPDSVLEKMHSPTKATLFSAALPGLGQIYNKKYWKVPIIYAGFGVFTYFIVTNAQEYNKFKNAYIESAAGDTSGKYSDLVKKYTPENLVSSRDYYRRNLEVSIMLTAVWYILNILDATVDAHLFTYNIGENLSLKVDPVIIPSMRGDRNVTSGVKLCLKFR